MKHLKQLRWILIQTPQHPKELKLESNENGSSRMQEGSQLTFELVAGSTMRWDADPS